MADISNCRIVFIGRHHAITRQLGSLTTCVHDPPRSLDLPNGDTPMPDGGTLVTEIGGSWIDSIGPNGKLRWAVQAPVSYPSDAQWLGHGRILLTDYHAPGSVVEMTRSGRVLWRYGPASGPGELLFPSLALMLPNGLVAVNDDFRNRVVLIDPKTDAIVWQYGHTDVAGSSAGSLTRPDGMDFLPYEVADPGAAGPRVPHRSSRVGYRVRLKLREGRPSIEVPRGRGSVGRAPPCQGGGRGFESRRPLHATQLRLGRVPPRGPTILRDSGHRVRVLRT